jgi:hypothetical protein
MATSSKHVQIRAAVKALFASAPAIAGGRIHENRSYALPEGVDSQVHVNLAESRPDGSTLYTGHPIDWATDIEIRIKARKSGTDEASTVVDAIWQQAWARLMGDATALGGLSQGIAPGPVNWDDDQEAVGVESLTCYFTVTHRTNNDDLAT